MSWEEDERTEEYYRYCYSCGDRWKMSDIDSTKVLPSIIVPKGCTKRNGSKGGNFIICSWCNTLFKKSKLLKLIRKRNT